jgi:PAS domain S-box-containing protein
MNFTMIDSLCCILDLFIAERRKPFCLKALEPVPVFFSGLFSRALDQDGVFAEFQDFPVLERFVRQAEDLWASESDGRLESELWVQTDPDGQEQEFQAVALVTKARKLLFVKRLDPRRSRNCELCQRNAAIQTCGPGQGDPLFNSHERYRKLFEQSTEAFLMILADGTVIDANPACWNLFGSRREEMLGAKIKQFYWNPDDRKTFLAALESSGHVANFKWRVRRKDGSPRHCIVNSTAWRNSDGELLAHISTVRDVTERLATEELLRKSEEKYRTIVEGIEEGYYEVDFRGNVVFCNSSLARILGYSVDELIGLNYTDYMDKSYLHDLRKTFNRVRRTGRAAEISGWKLVRREGTPLDIEASITLIRDSSGKPVGFRGVCRDVTEMKRAEQERLLLVTAIEQAAESIMITDADETILYTNPAFERITGYTSQEAAGKKAGFIMSGKHDPDFYRLLARTLAKGKVWSGRFVNRRKDGSIFHEEATISPVKDESGRVVSYVAVKRDVTREVRLEEELRQAQKMEAIGTLAGGVAHDFNNILSAIFGFTQLALDEAKEGTRQHAALTEVAIAAERAAELVKQILTFSRKSEQEKRIVNLSTLLKEVLKFLRASLPSTIDIRLDAKVPHSQIMADPTQIHQVFMNLCTNAWHAMREKGGKLEVRLNSVTLDANSPDLDGDMNPGAYLVLNLSDSGNGIEPHIRDRIFEPYFTTKRQGEGTGLGLAVVHGIVKSHGGSIRVESDVGYGTTFRVFFPMVEDEARDQAVLPEMSLRGDERILFVDDEAPIAKLATMMLNGLGYRVIAETDSMRAMEIFQSNPHGVDLIITDMTMPNMTGKQLASKILALRPDVPIILCTGFSEEIAQPEAKALGIRAFVMKPLNRDNLASIVREVLDNAAPSSTDPSDQSSE